MSFTSVDLVAGLYPTFQRGVPNQKPPDSYIQQFIDDTADMLVAILERRFNQAITQVSQAGSVNIWLASLGLANTTWYPQQPIVAGQTVIGTEQPLSCQIATGNGTTGDDYPSWNPVPGQTTTDGSVTWNNIGRSRQFNVLERGNRYGAASQLGAIMASFGVAAAAKLAEEYKKADWEPFCLELNAETKNGKAKAYGLFDFLFDPLANVQTPRPILGGIAGADQPYGIAPAQEGISSLMGKYGLDYGRQSGGTAGTGGGGWQQ